MCALFLHYVSLVPIPHLSACVCVGNETSNQYVQRKSITLYTVELL